MMKNKLLLFAAIALINISLFAENWSRPIPVMSPLDLTGVAQYFYNVEYCGFLVGANDWGTRASVSRDNGLSIAVNSTGDNVYKMGAFSPDETNSLWIDGSRDGNGLFTFDIKDNGYFAIGNKKFPETYVTWTGVEADTRVNFTVSEENGTWYAVSSSDYYDYMQNDRNKLELSILAEKLKAAIDNAKSRYEDIDLTEEENVYAMDFDAPVTATLQQLEDAINSVDTKLKSEILSNPQIGDDLTFCLQNPMFSESNGKGWTFVKTSVVNAFLTGGYSDFPCAEAWSNNNLKFDVYQEVSDMPNGLYSISCNAFVRMGGNQSTNIHDNGGAYLYMNDFLSQIGTVFTEGISKGDWDNGMKDSIVCGKPLYTNDQPWTLHNALGKYFPDGMKSASQAFALGMYKTTAYGLVEDGKMRIGFTKVKDNNSDNQWVLWTNFQLHYMEKDSTALDAVLRTYIERARMMIDTLSIENKDFVIRSLETGIERASSSLGKDGETMYNSLIYINSCIKNYIDNLEMFIVRINDLQTLYESALDFSIENIYSGLADFQTVLQEVKFYCDSGYISLDSSYSDLEYIEMIINKLTTSIQTYNDSKEIPFPEELMLLKSVVSSVKGYSVYNSHIASVDISRCGLKSFPLALFTLPGLTSVNASHNNISTIYIPDDYKNMVEGVDINLQYQDIDRTIDMDYDRIVNYQSLIPQIPILPYYDFATNSFMANGMAMKAATQRPTEENDNNWAVSVVYNTDMPNILSASSGDTAYHGNSGDTLYITYPLASDEVKNSFYRARFFFEQGDANFIKGVDVTDLQSTILYAFGGYRSYPFNFTAADTYKDGNINVQDVICTVNILLDSNGELSQEARSKQVKRTTLADADAYIYINDGKVLLHSNVPVASLSIKASGHINWNFERIGLMQSTANGNVVAYSLNGTTIQSSEDVVIGECTNATLCSVSLSDAYAQPISVNIVSDNTTSIINITETNNRSCKIYDVSGFSKNSVGKGINIIQSKGKTIKVYNK